MHFAGGDGVLHGLQVARIQCCCKVGDCWSFQSLFCVLFSWYWILFWFADLCLCGDLSVGNVLILDIILFCWYSLFWSFYVFCFPVLDIILICWSLWSFGFLLPILVYLFKWWSNMSFVLKQLLKKHFSSGASTAPTFFVLTVWWLTRCLSHNLDVDKNLV